MYGPVRTVVWQGSAGDRRPYADHSQIVATDDKKAIDACKLARIPFVSALGVLVRLKENGFLSQHDALSKLDVLESVGRYRGSLLTAVRSKLEGK